MAGTETTTVRISWETEDGEIQSGTLDIRGRPYRLVNIEYWYGVSCPTEPVDLIAPEGVLGDFEDNPYLDLFKSGEYKVVKPEEGNETG